MDVVFPEFRDVSALDIMRFFQQKLPNMCCPACANNDLNLDVTDDAKFAEWAAPSPHNNELFWPVVVVSCPNCGHISPFSYSFIANWIDQNPADKPE